MNLEIANRLLALRREHGYSQEELAYKLGVSRQAVSKWERAESSPDTDNLLALARLYGVSLDALLLHTPAGAAAQAAPTRFVRERTIMELELKRDAIHCFETVADVTICQEETQEAIVPDACPDIWQVLDGEARLLLQRKEPQDGKGEFSGLLKTTILYQPEGEQGLRAMEVTLPFSASPELTQLTRRSMLHVIPRVLSVDVHLLNPRKVLVRVGYCLDIEGFEPQARSLTSLVEEPERYGIRQKTGELRSFQTVYAQEKAFTYQDTVVLPAGRPDAVERVRTRAQCTCTEARVIGSKLVFKGEAMLQLLCRGEDGALFTGEFHLPYSQIMDAGRTVRWACAAWTFCSPT